MNEVKENPYAVPADRRQVEKMGYANHWVRCRMSSLVPGDVFRMFEPDGSPVSSGSGRTEWTVTSVPEVNGDGVMQVEAE